jgi:hypothetical protein
MKFKVGDTIQRKKQFTDHIYYFEIESIDSENNIYLGFDWYFDINYNKVRNYYKHNWLDIDYVDKQFKKVDIKYLEDNTEEYPDNFTPSGGGGQFSF